MSESNRDHTEHDSLRDSEPPLLLLEKALGEPPRPQRSLLPKIQERIHQRTHGRYYGRRRRMLRDPVSLLLGAALLLLILAAAAYLVLSGLLAS